MQRNLAALRTAWPSGRAPWVHRPAAHWQDGLEKDPLTFAPLNYKKISIFYDQMINLYLVFSSTYCVSLLLLHFELFYALEVYKYFSRTILVQQTFYLKHLLRAQESEDK